MTEADVVAADANGADASSRKDKEKSAAAALAALVSRGVSDSDKRLLARAARQTLSAPLRRSCTPESIMAFATMHARPQAVSLIAKSLGVSPPAATVAATDLPSEAAPELDVVALLNTIVYHVDRKDYKKVSGSCLCSPQGCLGEVLKSLLVYIVQPYP